MCFFLYPSLVKRLRPEADREARKSDKHIDLMDLEKFIDLWEANYEKIPEEGKVLLPLIKVSFLAPKEE